MHISNCKLCLQVEPLCKSHIIPEFCYTPLYDEKHKYIEAVISERKINRPQKGIYERLLCQRCEAIFNRWETHVQRLFVDPLKPYPHSKRLFESPDLKPDFTKLFALSVLWRASVAKGDTFELVSLGPHSEKIRQILISQIAPDSIVYAVQIYEIFFQGTRFSDFMVAPSYFRRSACRIFRILMRGFLFCIYVSTHLPPEDDLRFSIGSADKVQIINTDFTEFSFLVDAWNRVNRATAHLP